MPHRSLLCMPDLKLVLSDSWWQLKKNHSVSCLDPYSPSPLLSHLLSLVRFLAISKSQGTSLSTFQDSPPHLSQYTSLYLTSLVTSHWQWFSVPSSTSLSLYPLSASHHALIISVHIAIGFLCVSLSPLCASALCLATLPHISHTTSLHCAPLSHTQPNLFTAPCVYYIIPISPLSTSHISLTTLLSVPLWHTFPLSFSLHLLLHFTSPLCHFSLYFSQPHRCHWLSTRPQ